LLKENIVNNVRTISAREVLTALSAGMTATEMASKFRVSFGGLQKIFDRLVSERHDRGLKILADIHEGMPVREIAARNGFPEEKFGLIVRRLEELGLLGRENLQPPDSEVELELDLEDRRSVPRLHVPVLTTRVFEANDPNKVGLIMDLSELGLRIKGISARVNEEKTLIMNVGDFAQTQLLKLECRCRWILTSPLGRGHEYSGFAITGISEDCMGFLKTMLASEYSLSNVA
jgi:hypothetical protein